MSIWSNNRPGKICSRNLAADFTPRKSALYLPADEMKCVEVARESGMISTDFTHLHLIERNEDTFLKMRAKAIAKNWYPNHADVFQGELCNYQIQRPLDYAWIDLNGTLSEDLVNWVSSELVPNLEDGAVVCLTHEYCWRNNVWLKGVWDQVLSSPEWSLGYAKFRRECVVMGDRHLSFPPFLISSLLSPYCVDVLEPIRYADTIDMVFYRFVVQTQGEKVMPAKTKRGRRAAAIKAHETRNRQPVVASDVIEALVDVEVEGSSSHRATRLLNRYVEQQLELGHEENRTRAAIKAHVTRRVA